MIFRHVKIMFVVGTLIYTGGSKQLELRGICKLSPVVLVNCYDC